MNKMSIFIIGLLVVAIFVVGFSAFYASIGNTYGMTYEDTTSNMNKYSEINNITSSMNNQVVNETQTSGGFAIIGDFLGYGYQTLRLSLASLDLFSSMAETAFDNIPAGGDTASSNAMSQIKYILITIVFIVVIFIIIAFLANRAEL